MMMMMMIFLIYFYFLRPLITDGLQGAHRLLVGLVGPKAMTQTRVRRPFQVRRGKGFQFHRCRQASEEKPLLLKCGPFLLSYKTTREEEMHATPQRAS